MNLKESFRYQNYLNSMFLDVTCYLSSPSYMSTTTQTHMRKKANPDAEDEVQVVQFKKPLECDDNNIIIEFLEDIIHEEEAVYAAISATKKALPFDMDVEISVNKNRRVAAGTLERAVKGNVPTECITQGSAYKFNEEGNQVSYVYDVKETTTVDFDRDKAKALYKKLLEKADNASMDVDKAMVSVEVGFTPTYNIQDSTNDSLAAFMKSRSEAMAKPVRDNRRADV